MQRGTSTRKWFAAAVAAAVALTAAGARAQGTGTVQGTVTLAGGAGPVHGALVLVVGTGATALTEDDGRFALEGVPAGSYEVLAQREHLTAGRQMIAVAGGEVVTVDFELAPSPIHEQVTVTASAGGAETTFEAFNAVTTLDSHDLVQGAHGTLGAALQNEPGIASRSFGPGSSRPIIRGFDGDRVLILDDGVRTGDLSSQSGDHGVTLDPAGAERIEIVRGPATLLYGSNAVGGLVNVISPHESQRESRVDGTRAQIATDAGSANAQAGVSANLQHAQGSLRVWAGGSTRRSGDYETPDGTVANSASELANARAGVGYDSGRFFASGGFTLEQGRHGVPFADEFHGAHGHGHEDEHGEGEEEGLEVDLTSRRQVGRFDIGLRNLSNRLVDGLRVTMNVIDWAHDELEVADGIENMGTTFANRSYVVRAELDQQQTERLSGRFGAWTQVRDFEATGFEALAPRTDLTAMAAFAYEEVDFGPFRLQFGGRVERNSYRAGDRMSASITTTTPTSMTTTTMPTSMATTTTPTSMATTTTMPTSSSSRCPTPAIGRSSELPGQSACTSRSASAARSSPTSRARTARPRSRSSTTSARTWGISRSRWGTPICAPRRRSASTSASGPAAAGCAAS